MTRREMMSLVAAGISLQYRLPAAELPGSYYRDYSRCLPGYLSSLARIAYEKRNRAIATLTTVDAIHKRQRWATETFLRPDRRPNRTDAPECPRDRNVRPRRLPS